MAVNTAVLVAIAASSAAGTAGFAAASSRRGTWIDTDGSVAELGAQFVAGGHDDLAHLLAER